MSSGQKLRRWSILWCWSLGLGVPPRTPQALLEKGSIPPTYGEICSFSTFQILNLMTHFSLSFYFCFLGTSGISLSHNFYCGSIFKSNSLWTSLSPQCLPPQWLELTRFYNCGCRVSIPALSCPFLPLQSDSACLFPF